jgi:uncharacterized protein (DUF305 family)
LQTTTFCFREELLLKLYAKFGLPILLLVLAILLASCGGTSGGSNKSAGTEDKFSGKEKDSRPAKSTGGMKGMDHGLGDVASGMVMKNGKYSDERFIDAMVPHHQGAVEMARVALKNAEHLDIEQLAEDIITTQRAEIKDLKSIKQEEFGTSRVRMHMSMGQMKSMGIMIDSQSLANENPFDKAFIDNMIPHHKAAIEMTEVARKESKNPRIKELATNIVDAQKQEISQMKQRRKRWYQKG